MWMDLYWDVQCRNIPDGYQVCIENQFYYFLDNACDSSIRGILKFQNEEVQDKGCTSWCATFRSPEIFSFSNHYTFWCCHISSLFLDLPRLGFHLQWLELEVWSQHSQISYTLMQFIFLILLLVFYVSFVLSVFFNYRILSIKIWRISLRLKIGKDVLTLILIGYNCFLSILCYFWNVIFVMILSEYQRLITLRSSLLKASTNASNISSN